MKRSASNSFALLAAAMWCLAITACAPEPGADNEVSGEADVAAAQTAEQTPTGTDDNLEMSEAPASGEEGSQGEGEGEHGRSEGSEGEGEHGEEGEGGEHDSGGEGEEGEESGVYIGRDDTWDAIRRGARLVLSFDDAGGAFVGTVENTTEQTLCAVRVEVHLSTGTELGPTERTDVPVGGTTAVRLSAAGEAFDTWTAHPELTACSGG